MRAAVAAVLRAGAAGDEELFLARVDEAQALAEHDDEAAQWLLCAIHFGMYYFHAEDYEQAVAHQVAEQLQRTMPVPCEAELDLIGSVLRASFYDHLPERRRHRFTRPLHRHLYEDYGALMTLPYPTITGIVACVASSVVHALSDDEHGTDEWAELLATESVRLMAIQQDWDSYEGSIELTYHRIVDRDDNEEPTIDDDPEA
jgi:hypothetical protein